jgi:hypothetical protein
MPFLQSNTVAARRGGALILPVSENDIIFAYRFVLITAAVNCNSGLQKMASFLLTDLSPSIPHFL